MLTGDNGLGKSFLLDVLWYALTWSWAGEPALPHPAAQVDERRRPGQGNFLSAWIAYGFDDQRFYDSGYHIADQRWLPRTSTAGFSGGLRLIESPFPGDGVVVYARVDGGFAVWDSFRNRGRTASDPETRPRSFVLDRDQVWNGLEDDKRILSNGLVRDWVSWQQAGNGAFAQLAAAVADLSGEGVEAMTIGAPRRVRVDDTRDFPTLELPYGNVPLTHASAGMRRICSLAYMLVWTWHEHRLAAEILRQPPCKELVLLVDEVEAHLHPQWQRRIVPALLGAMKALAPEVTVQFFLATHSPLVLASLEVPFDAATDASIHLDLQGQNLVAERRPFAKQGDATGWLVSDTFGLAQARSVPAQEAIEAAEALMRGEAGEGRAPAQVHHRLLATLGELDPFWPRWIGWWKKVGAP